MSRSRLSVRLAPHDVRHPSGGNLYHVSGIETNWSLPWKEYLHRCFPERESFTARVLEMGGYHPSPPGVPEMTEEELYLYWSGENGFQGESSDYSGFAETEQWLQRNPGFSYAHPRVVMASIASLGNMQDHERNMATLLANSSPADHRQRYAYSTVGILAGTPFRFQNGSDGPMSEVYFSLCIWRMAESISITVEKAYAVQDPYMTIALTRKR